MENSELEIKYHKLATEYSKVRSYASVLKKAVLDEQAKIITLNDKVKEQEQKLRRHDQEMESITFRNDQLTKRISVLQQELLTNNHGKKSKNKNDKSNIQSNFGVFDEELQKKIIENAHLASTMADKEMEIASFQEKVEWMEERMAKMQNDFSEKTANYIEQIEKMQKQDKVQVNNQSSSESTGNFQSSECDVCNSKSTDNNTNHFEKEAERWKTECDILRARPQSNEQLMEYYESQIRELIDTKQLCQSETMSLWADNNGLKTRLEHMILQKNSLESILEKSNEELHTTSENYKSQLDAMTEHLAAQNEKITKQCDEIDLLKHKISLK